VNKEEATKAVLKMTDGDVIYINWFQESGGKVEMINGKYYLSEINQCGCEFRFNTYNKEDIGEMVNVAYSWT